MAQNNLRVLLLFLIINILSCFNIFADDDSSELEAGYFIDFSGDVPRIIQRFVWEKEEYASRYEITIQSYNGFYTDFIIENTEKTFFEVSLHPGLYRYSVVSFDLLDTRAEASPWKQFEIIGTYVPQVRKFLPEAFYLDRDNERILHISGININKDSNIYLSNDLNQLIPVSVTVVNEEKAVLVFDDKLLVPGAYDIYILNPSGIGTKTGTFNIGYSKPLDYFIRAAYTPVIPIYGENWELFGADLFLVGFSLGIEFISSKRNTFNGGLELCASAFFLNPSVSLKANYADYMDGLEGAGDGAFFCDFDLNFAFQKRLFINEIYFTLRSGVGVAFFSGFGAIEDNGFALKLNVNFSTMFKIYKILHIDIGADYSHYMSNEPFGLIKPRIGFVWRQ